MSCSKWRWTPECDSRPCCGDCDNCDYDVFCYNCDECRHYDGDFAKRSRWTKDCPHYAKKKELKTNG